MCCLFFRSGVDEFTGLFVEPLSNDTAIQRMIDHAGEVAHWVAGEIVACSNPKVSRVIGACRNNKAYAVTIAGISPEVIPSTVIS